jgi:hypothetical protein
MRTLVVMVALLLFAAAPCIAIATSLDELLISTACQKQGADAVVCTFADTLILTSDAWPPGANVLTISGSTSSSTLQLQPSAPYRLTGSRSLFLSSLIIDAGLETTSAAGGLNKSAVAMLMNGFEKSPSAYLYVRVSA